MKMRDEIKKSGKTIELWGDFWIKEIYCAEEISIEELTDVDAKIRRKDGFSRIVLEGNWKMNGDEDIMHGYIQISSNAWIRYLSYCKDNDLRPTPVGALRYENETRKYQYKTYINCYDVSITNFLSDGERRITDMFPETPEPIQLSLKKEYKIPLKPLELLGLFTVPLDVATFPIQLLRVIPGLR
jgi:hypothetical protein